MAEMRILLLMLLPIGDTLFATPAIHALRKRYPNARITALVYPTNQGVLASNPDVDDFLVWPTLEVWPGFRGVHSLFRTLRGSRFDLAVEFCNYIWWVTLLSGIPRRTEMRLPRLWWLLPSAGQAWRKKHAVEHYADAVRRLRIPVEDMRLRFQPTAEEERRALAWLDQHRVGPDDLLIGLHPGGEGLWGRKRWGIEGFARVAEELAARTGARILIMGGRAESHLAEQLQVRTRTNIINATGKTTLGETAALLARCVLFVGNDSSPLHIAAACGTRVVGIYGLTDPRSYHPWIPGGTPGIDYAVVRSDLPCACCFPLGGGITLAAWARCLFCPALKTITPEQVLGAAISLLSNTKRETGILNHQDTKITKCFRD